MEVEIHGIDERTVEGKLTIADLADELRGRLDRSIIVSHTGFDRNALERTLSRYGLEPPRSVRWLDSARVARRTWPDRYGERGYAPKKVAAAMGIAFRHHDALEDARAAAEIMLRACDETRAWTRTTGWRASSGRSMVGVCACVRTVGSLRSHGRRHGRPRGPRSGRIETRLGRKPSPPLAERSC